MENAEIRTEFSKRFNKLLDHYEYATKYSGRQVQLKNDFGVSQETTRKWLSGESIPRREKLKSICERFPARIEWLEHGTGKMLKDKNVERLNFLYEKAKSKDQEMILQIAEKLLRDQDPENQN